MNYEYREATSNLDNQETNLTNCYIPRLPTLWNLLTISRSHRVLQVAILNLNYDISRTCILRHPNLSFDVIRNTIHMWMTQGTPFLRGSDWLWFSFIFGFLGIVAKLLRHQLSTRRGLSCFEFSLFFLCFVLSPKWRLGIFPFISRCLHKNWIYPQR